MNSSIKLATLVAFVAPMLAASPALADLDLSNDDVLAAASCAAVAAASEDFVSNECQMAADAACNVVFVTADGAEPSYGIECNFVNCAANCYPLDFGCLAACAINPLADVQAACEAEVTADGDLWCNEEYAGVASREDSGGIGVAARGNIGYASGVTTSVAASLPIEFAADILPDLPDLPLE